MTFRLVLFFAFLTITVSTAAEDDPVVDSGQIEKMVHRYVFGMEKLVKKSLVATGLDRMEVDRIAADFSAQLRECMATSFAEDADVPVDESNDAVDSCVKQAFENAGVAYPFDAP